MFKKLALATLMLATLILLFGCRGGGPPGHELTSRAKGRQGTGEKKERTASIVFDTAPFDVGRTSLPPHYDGNDITRVYRAFEAETTPPESRENRATGRVAAPAGGGDRRMTDAYAFKVSTAPGPPNNQFWYDRHRGAFKIRIRTEPFFDASGNMDTNKIAFALAGYSQVREPTWTEDYGDQMRWLLWEVLVSSDPRLRERMETDKSGTFLAMEGKVPSGDAPLSKDISVLLVCRPRSAEEGLSTGPGVSPAITGSAFRHYYLKSDLLELWVYDYRTGRVFKREKILSDDR